MNIAIELELGRSQDSINARLDYERALSQFQNAEIKEEEFYRRHLRVDPEPAAIRNYTGDLNAAHAAWLSLNEQEQWEFGDELGKIIEREFPDADEYRRHALETNAKAYHRSEAFLNIVAQRAMRE